MPYVKNTLIMKPVGLAGLWDDIKDVAKGAVDIYGTSKKNEGAAGALQTQTSTVPMMSGGIDTTTLLMIGALGIGAIVLLKKKK